MSLTREEIYQLLVASKREYVQSSSDGYIIGMCKAIDHTCMKLFPHVYESYDYYYLYRLIPEFNPAYLDTSGHLNSYWWLSYDSESRLEAFDKLISLYRDGCESLD